LEKHSCVVGTFQVNDPPVHSSPKLLVPLLVPQHILGFYNIFCGYGWFRATLFTHLQSRFHHWIHTPPHFLFHFCPRNKYFVCFFFNIYIPSFFLVHKGLATPSKVRCVKQWFGFFRMAPRPRHLLRHQPGKCAPPAQGLPCLRISAHL
jgi:hypothetical protein